MPKEWPYANYITVARIEDKGRQTMLLVSVYTPQEREDRLRMLTELSVAIRKVNRQTVLAGDWNCPWNGPEVSPQIVNGRHPGNNRIDYALGLKQPRLIDQSQVTGLYDHDWVS